MRYEYNDGGRSAAGFKGQTGDCTCRAIAIATRLGYEYVYDMLNENVKNQRISKRQPKRGSARTGIYKTTIRKILDMLGWEWHPTMQIGSGCKVHLRDGELPMGRLIVSVSKHMVAVVDGVIQDTHDPSRGGTRCVYGYWSES